jgi:hypothetical protein
MSGKPLVQKTYTTHPSPAGTTLYTSTNLTYLPPDGHTLPQAPQLLGSATHGPLQSVAPLEHEVCVHAPETQIWPVAVLQLVPHAPQFVLLVCVCLHKYRCRLIALLDIDIRR